jgi:hypothetical protein
VTARRACRFGTTHPSQLPVTLESGRSTIETESSTERTISVRLAVDNSSASVARGVQRTIRGLRATW